MPPQNKHLLTLIFSSLSAPLRSGFFIHSHGYVVSAVDFVIKRLAVRQDVTLIEPLKLGAVVIAAVVKLLDFILRYSAVAFLCYGLY